MELLVTHWAMTVRRLVQGAGGNSRPTLMRPLENLTSQQFQLQSLQKTRTFILLQHV